MLVFTSCLFIFGVFHVAIGRAKEYLCANYIINSDKISDFNIENFLMVQGLITLLYFEEGDKDFKKCVINVIKFCFN